MYELLIHKELTYKVKCLHITRCKFMYLGFDNIQRDLPHIHYRFKIHSNIVVLLGYKTGREVKLEDYINIKNTDIAVLYKI